MATVYVNRKKSINNKHYMINAGHIEQAYEHDRMTIRIMNRLSVTYFAHGLYDESLAMINEVTRISKQHLGMNHSGTKSCVEALSVIRQAVYQKKNSNKHLN